MKRSSLYFYFCLLLICLTRTKAHAQTDTVSPVITLKGDSILKLAVFNTYMEPGITITDNVDVISSWDTSGTFYEEFPNAKANKTGPYTITYTARDKSGNTGTKTRIVYVVDTIPPVIKLTDTSINCVFVGEPIVNYTQFTYSDNYSANNGIMVVQTQCGKGFHTTDSPGIIRFYYTAIDQSGNSSSTPLKYIIVKVKGDTSACVLHEPKVASCAQVTAVVAPHSPIAFNLYPNPAGDLAYLTLAETSMQQLTIRLLDIHGRCLWLTEAGKGTDRVSIPTATLSNGMYLVELHTPYQKQTCKLLIAH